MHACICVHVCNCVHSVCLYLSVVSSLSDFFFFPISYFFLVCAQFIQFNIFHSVILCDCCITTSSWHLTNTLSTYSTSFDVWTILCWHVYNDIHTKSSYISNTVLMYRCKSQCSSKYPLYKGAKSEYLLTHRGKIEWMRIIQLTYWYEPWYVSNTDIQVTICKQYSIQVQNLVCLMTCRYIAMCKWYPADIQAHVDVWKSMWLAMRTI